MYKSSPLTKHYCSLVKGFNPEQRTRMEVFVIKRGPSARFKGAAFVYGGKQTLTHNSHPPFRPLTTTASSQYGLQSHFFSHFYWKSLRLTY